MARAYSQDLRDRVIDAALAGVPARHAAARFGVGDATAIVGAAGARDRGAHGAQAGTASTLEARSPSGLSAGIDRGDAGLDDQRTPGAAACRARREGQSARHCGRFSTVAV